MRVLFAIASILAAAPGARAAAEPPAANHLKQIGIVMHAPPAALQRSGDRNRGAVAMESLKLQHEGFNGNAGAARWLDEPPAPPGARRWEHTYEYRPGKFARTDYDFGKSRYTGVRLQQGRVSSDTDWNESPSAAPGSAKRQRYAAPLDDLPPGPPALQHKSRVDLPGTGAPFSGKYRVAGTTHKAPESAGYKAKFKAGRSPHR